MYIVPVSLLPNLYFIQFTDHSFNDKQVSSFHRSNTFWNVSKDRSQRNIYRTLKNEHSHYYLHSSTIRDSRVSVRIDSIVSRGLDRSMRMKYDFNSRTNAYILQERKRFKYTRLPSGVRLRAGTFLALFGTPCQLYFVSFNRVIIPYGVMLKFDKNTRSGGKKKARGTREIKLYILVVCILSTSGRRFSSNISLASRIFIVRGLYARFVTIVYNVYTWDSKK